MTRRGYLDWLRGLAVLVMIEGHTLDAWSRPVEHARSAYRVAAFLAGFGAPLFLFLAGVALALAAGSRRDRGLSNREVARMALGRGAQIFGIAFLLRLQSWAISQGPFGATLLKVDVLHIMGLSMMGVALVWVMTRRPRDRAMVLIALAAATALAAPSVQMAAWVGALPAPLAWYLRPEPGWTQFALFPWSGFVFAGAAVGVWLEAAVTPAMERRTIGRLAASGVLAALAGYGLSLMPPLFAGASFWTTSPTFFALRVGIVALLVAASYVWNAARREPSWLHRLGTASLFVYWIHVELVYGVPTMWIHRRLSLEQGVIGVLVVTALMYGLVVLKARYRPAYNPPLDPAR